MRYSEKIKRIEEKVYDALDSLEDEFNISINNYPEVIYLGRGVIPETIGLSPFLTSHVRDSKKSRVSKFLYKPNMVLIAEDLPVHINEESAHCLHFNTAKFTFYNLKESDWFAQNIIIEMFGYLGSKILDPSRKNVYEDYPDYFAIAKRGGLDGKRL